jgi:hypothetical protein
VPGRPERHHCVLSCPRNGGVGRWVDGYSGIAYGNTPTVTIDHVVALKGAWDSGAAEWDAARKTAFANDVADRVALAVVSTSSNTSKGDRDPGEWLPADKNPATTLGHAWFSIKVQRGLSADVGEVATIRLLLTGAVTATAKPATTVKAVTTTTRPATTVAEGTPTNRSDLRQLHRRARRWRGADHARTARLPTSGRHGRQRNRLRICHYRIAGLTGIGMSYSVGGDRQGFRRMSVVSPRTQYAGVTPTMLLNRLGRR